jgi:glyceraldehyde-3-phosphate dehydrogenase (NADP+)
VILIEEGDATVATQSVMGCCTAVISPTTTDESYPTCKTDLLDSVLERQVIGKMPQFTQDQAVQVLHDAQEAWKGGSGVWPQLSWRERVTAIQNLVAELELVREQIIETLMWEIGKNYPDAASEFDRTMSFIQQVYYSCKAHPLCIS